MQETNSFVNPLASVLKFYLYYSKYNNTNEARAEGGNLFLINVFMNEGGSSETTREAPKVPNINHLGEDIVRPGRKLLL